MSKLRYSFFLMIFGAVLGGMEITTDKPGHIFSPGETLRFKLTDHAASGAEYAVLSLGGKKLHSGKVTPENQRAGVTIPANREWEGRFLRFQCGHRTIPFAILPERKTAAGGDDRFGAWLNSDRFHEPLYQAGLRIGITTSYPHSFLYRKNPWRLQLPNKYGMPLTTNLTVCPLDQNFRGYQKTYRTRETMSQFDAAKFGSQVEAYQRDYAGPLKLRRVSSSLGGEFCYLTADSAEYLRNVHRTFYASAKKGAPEVKVALGLLMAHGVSTLQCLLDGTTPADFPFDYLAYDICGKGDQVEMYLKADIQFMEKWGRRVPQWVCETWSRETDDVRTAAALARIYGASIGLGCVEVDWHSVWNECTDNEEWEGLIRAKKRSTVHRPMFSQALFRGKNYQLTPAAIAYYHVSRNLAFAVPVGEIREDFNLASYRFQRQDGKIVTMLWTRDYPVNCTFKAAGKCSLHDCMGEVNQTLPAKNGTVSLKVNSAPVYLISDKPPVLNNVTVLSHFRKDNF